MGFIGLKNKLLYLFFLLLFSGTVYAQDVQIVVERVPFMDGGNKDIYYILQDTTGLMWLMAEDKWYTSDGEKIFEVPRPFHGDDARTLKGSNSTRNENFYIAGDSVRIYNPYSRTVIQSIGLDESNDTQGKTHLLYNIVPVADSLTWAYCSTASNGDYKLEVMLSRKGLPFKPMHSITTRPSSTGNMSVRGDQLFISKADTILQYDTDGNLVKAHALPSASMMPLAFENHIKKNKSLEYLHFVKNPKTGQMDRAFYYLKPNSTEFEYIAMPELNDLDILRLRKTGKDYWLMGARMSLYHFIPGKEKVIDYSKYILQQHPEVVYFRDYVYSVYRDKTETIWVSTALNGVFKLSSTEEPFKRYLAGKRAYPFCAYNSCLIRGITSDDKGNIYFGYDYGIKKIDPKTGVLTELSLNLTDKLQAVFSLSYFNQKLYLNAMEIDPLTGNTVPIIPGKNSNNITHLIDEERGEMWIADAGKVYQRYQAIDLYLYNFETKALKLIKHFEPAGYLNQVSQLHLSPTTNTLFMATTYDGLYEVSRAGDILQHFSEKDNTPTGVNSMVLSLYEDSNQQLWIGSAYKLRRLDLQTKKLIGDLAHINGRIKASRIYILYPQNDTFCWIGTSHGLYRLNVKTEEVKSFNMFPFQAQMEFNRNSTHQSSDGTFYFGSVEGLFVFHPDSLFRDARLAEQFQVQISRFSTFDINKDSLVHNYQNLATTSTFHIYPNYRYFTFDIFVPDFRDAEKNTYSWWLEGYDPRWSKPTTTNTISYENLPAGEYTLHIKGGIIPDYYESSERQLKVIVYPIWYNTWWARSLLIITFLALVYLLYRYQINQQLEKAEARRLKELDTLKSRLYTNITHEFRTPLTVILGMTENIKGHSQEKSLITRNSKNLLRLINQLLDLSKLDSGTLKMDKIQGDIVNYLQYLTESFYSMAEDKQIRLTFYPEIRDLIMDYDETKIQHIVYNLLTNAIKFTPEGGKVILHVKKLEKNGLDWLHLKFSDTGIGISKENLPKIFNRFYQGDTSPSGGEAGTGIGLAFTKELVEMMGGRIVVESKLGTGTDILILLPIIKDAETRKQNLDKGQFITTPDNESNLPLSKENLVPSLDLNTFNINSETPSLLIIEDNRDVVTYIESLLKKHYRIEVARNGQEGIDKAFSIIPDIIISDVMMPEKDGYEVCQILKNDERSSHIPIILLTAKASPEDRIQGLKGGADAYLVKPFNKDELFIRLEKLIGLRKALQERYVSPGNFLNTTKPLTAVQPSLDDLFIEKLLKVVQDRLDDPKLEVADLCQAVHLSNMQVNRKLKALTGKTPSRFIRSIRLQKAMQLLKTTTLNISEIAYEVGFSDPNYFSRTFSEEFDFPPNTVRK
jgi:signal transduction histidine kinase/DNA-binding response OmpR family regulator